MNDWQKEIDAYVDLQDQAVKDIIEAFAEVFLYKLSTDKFTFECLNKQVATVHRNPHRALDGIPTSHPIFLQYKKYSNAMCTNVEIRTKSTQELVFDDEYYLDLFRLRLKIKLRGTPFYLDNL